MNQRNLFVVIILCTLIFSCGSNSDAKKKSFSIETENNESKFKLGEVLNASISNPKNKEIDSVIFFINDRKIKNNSQSILKEPIDGERLGNQLLRAQVYYDGDKSEEISKKIVFLNNKAPELYSYEIIASYPHDPKAFTQGLEFYKDTLFESTGKNGSSSLRKVDVKTGKILQKTDIDNQYFAEGITALNNKIIQLTWKSKEGFIYDSQTLKKTGSFAYNQSKEGWGLCNNGTKIYKSDGTERIWILNADTLAEEHFIEVTTNKSVKSKFNELEWVEGKIYANTWQKDGIAIINPNNGALEGVINLSGLRDKVAQHDQLDVLNGIAYKSDTKQLFVTGKNWDTLFEIKIMKK